MYLMKVSKSWSYDQARAISKTDFFFSIPSPKNPTWTHGSILKDIYEIPYYSIIEESPRITYIFVQKNTY